MESPSLEDEGTILLALEDRKFSPNPGGGLAKWGGGVGFLTLFFGGGGATKFSLLGRMEEAFPHQ